MVKHGTVYLVGAGPGDPGLITVRGQELLQRADVVIYDHLVAPRLLALRPSGARLIYVGKEAGQHAKDQGEINRLLIRSAKTGKTVVRLKGGDPFVFGRGGEEALALATAKIPFEVVPGVTSAIAAPAYAGIPVTHRDLSSSVTFITGHEDPAKPETAIRWDRLAASSDTLVCLMGVSKLDRIAGALLRHGRAPGTPCAVIAAGTTPEQRTVAGTLRTIASEAKRAAIRPPAILVVGDVVSLRRSLGWVESKPLSGRRILVTRAFEKAEPFARQLEALGARVAQLPAIKLAPVKANGMLRQAIEGLPQTDWVFFTSPEGIGWFAKLLRPYHKDVHVLKRCRIGAIGPKTAAALEQAGLRVDLVPRRFSQEGMLQDLPRELLSGKRALILCAEESRDALAAGLRRRGMAVKKVPVYRTMMPEALKRNIRSALREPYDVVTVTSASCVEHLFQALQAVGRAAFFRRLPFASIGPVTSRAVRADGGRVVAEARRSTVDGLIEAITRYTETCDAVS